MSKRQVSVYSKLPMTQDAQSQEVSKKHYKISLHVVPCEFELKHLFLSLQSTGHGMVAQEKIVVLRLWRKEDKFLAEVVQVEDGTL